MSPPAAMSPPCLRRAARFALALVWLGEGLGLKLWLRDPTELAIVADSGLWLVSPGATLAAIGVLEVAAGLVLVSGWRERQAVVVTTLAMMAITAGVVWTDPSTLLGAAHGRAQEQRRRGVRRRGLEHGAGRACRRPARRPMTQDPTTPRPMTPRSIRLLDALDAHRDAFAAQLDALPPAAVHTRPGPDAWSLAHLAEHLALIDGGLLLDGPPMGAASRATSRVRSGALRAVLALPLRIKGPPSAAAVMPSAAPRWSEVRGAVGGRARRLAARPSARGRRRVLAPARRPVPVGRRAGVPPGPPPPPRRPGAPDAGGAGGPGVVPRPAGGWRPPVGGGVATGGVVAVGVAVAVACYGATGGASAVRTLVHSPADSYILNPVPGYDPALLARDLKAQALRVGFDGVGIARAERLDDEARRLEAWLLGDRHGGDAGAMAWMGRNFDKRIDPTVLVPGARSVVSVFASYWQPGRRPGEPRDALADADRDADGAYQSGAASATRSEPAAKISRYAWGDDYHDVLKEKLAELFDWLDRRTGGAGGRAFVDSAPVMDKAWAQRAGLGWQGKNTNLLTTTHGSFVFLGELIVDVPLAPDAPFTADHCGSCTRCLDACPTGALDAPYQIDATRCVSYWTIEHRGPDLPEIAGEFGAWAFGCDVCQDVCPWTKFSRPTRDARFLPRPGVPDTPAAEWLEIDLEAWRERFRRSPVKRSKYEGFLRNMENAARNARR